EPAAGQSLRRYAPPGLSGAPTQLPVNAGPGSGATPRRGVPPLPQPDRQDRAGPPRRARSRRQLLNAQDAVDPALAAPTPAFHAAFHADLQLLAQPRRALVRRADNEMDQARQPPLRPRARRLDPHLDHQLERQP